LGLDERYKKINKKKELKVPESTRKCQKVHENA